MVCGSRSAFHCGGLAAAQRRWGCDGTHYCSMSFRYCFERLPRILALAIQRYGELGGVGGLGVGGVGRCSCRSRDLGVRCFGKFCLISDKALGQFGEGAPRSSAAPLSHSPSRSRDTRKIAGAE